MTHESLSNAEWFGAVARLGGSELLEKEAREFGAFERARRIKCAVDQLRLVLAYCWGTRGLRLTAAWAEAMGLASLSNVALLKRLRNSADWLEQLVCRLLGAGVGAACVTDQSLPTAERESYAHLFAGPIGAHKNPHSHRKVTIDDLREAQRQVLQASHLLHIVDAAKARRSTKP
jgi:hypothetical protein